MADRPVTVRVDLRNTDKLSLRECIREISAFGEEEMKSLLKEDLSSSRAAVMIGAPSNSHGSAQAVSLLEVERKNIIFSVNGVALPTH